MKIPKEYAEKVKRYEEITKEAAQLYEDVVDGLNENTGADAVYIESLFVAEKPTGRVQEEDEYCEQWQCGCIEDSFEGYYYHQIEGASEYVGYRYST